MASIQQIGGNSKDKVQAMIDKHVPLIPITVHKAHLFIHLYTPDSIINLKDPMLWLINFYRVDDGGYAFYLDKTSSALPGLQSVSIRTYKL